MNYKNRNRGNAIQSGVEIRAKKMPVVDTDGRFKTKNKKHDTKIKNILNVEIFNRSRLFIECA